MEHTPHHHLSLLFLEGTKSAFPELPSEALQVELTRSTQERFGHYQCNSAMRLAKFLKKPPREVAQVLVEHLKKDPLIAKLEIAGPGFINITLHEKEVSKQLFAMLTTPHFNIPRPSQPQKIVIDFSSPNTAKEMHVGHLRSTVIGDSLARILEFLGHDVLRLNHVGDWGTAFGMLIAYMKDEVPEALEGTVQAEPEQLVSWYKASKKRFDEDAEFKKRSQLEVVALQSGEPQNLRAWKNICSISRKGYQEIYDLLDISIVERGESFYNPLLEQTISLLEKEGIVEENDGAKCIFIEGFKNRDGDPLPLIIQKSDGGYNYASTDLATLRHRIEEEKADRIIYVTDAGQATHFAMVFGAMKKAGFWDPKQVRVDHVPFGLVLGPDGKKFRTRSGETEKLKDLLEKSVHKARQLLDQRETDLEETEKQTLAKVMGIGSVKYADLSCNRVSDYAFSYDRMLRFEGNTAPYLLYAYVRIEGIKRKVGADMDEILKQTSIDLSHPSEISLGVHLLQFGETLSRLETDLLPNRLTDYLYELAEKFNRFFRDCRVLGSEEQNQRLLLCELTARMLKQGLALLGIQTVDRM